MDPLRSAALYSSAPTSVSSIFPRNLDCRSRKASPCWHPFRRENLLFRCADSSTRPPPPKRHPAATMLSIFDRLKDSLTIDVARAEGRPLDVPLARPFTIASSRLDRVANVAVRVQLRNGSVGWGEAPVLPSVTAEDQPAALAAATAVCSALVRSLPMTLGDVLQEVGRLLPGHEFASVSVEDNLFTCLIDLFRGLFRSKLTSILFYS